MIKITDFYMLCKWENLQNRQCIKYLFSPLYIYIHGELKTGSSRGLVSGTDVSSNRDEEPVRSVRDGPVVSTLHLTP